MADGLTRDPQGADDRERWAYGSGPATLAGDDDV